MGCSFGRAQFMVGRIITGIGEFRLVSTRHDTPEIISLVTISRHRLHHLRDARLPERNKLDVSARLAGLLPAHDYVVRPHARVLDQLRLLLPFQQRAVALSLALPVRLRRLHPYRHCVPPRYTSMADAPRPNSRAGPRRPVTAA